MLLCLWPFDLIAHDSWYDDVLSACWNWLRAVSELMCNFEVHVVIHCITDLSWTLWPDPNCRWGCSILWHSRWPEETIDPERGPFCLWYDQVLAVKLVVSEVDHWSWREVECDSKSHSMSSWWWFHSIEPEFSIACLRATLSTEASFWCLLTCLRLAAEDSVDRDQWTHFTPLRWEHELNYGNSQWKSK